MTPPTDDRNAAAEALAARIRDLALRGEHHTLLEIGADPATAPLLDRLGNDVGAAARAHLEGARRWRDRRHAANGERLDEARRAFAAFDLPIARKRLSRLETEWLTDEQAAERDDLLLAIEQRAIEAAELNAVARAAEEEHRKRRWWRRRRKR
jgi:hypothetical protein